MAFYRSLPGLLVAAALFMPVATHAAQPGAAPAATAPAPYSAVTTEKATLRCGEGEFFYKVGEVAAGVTLLVDGESGAWARVAYPQGVNGYVKAEEVDVQGGTARLTRPSRLLATNIAAPQSSWKVLLPAPLPEGTTLKVVGSQRDGNDGPIIGHYVVAPETARAFVESRVLRKQNEAAAVTDAKVPAPAADAPKAETLKPAAESPVATPPVDLTEPMVKPTDPAPVTINQTPSPNSVTPAAAAASGAPAVVEPVRVVGDWATLDRTFKNVWKQPVMEAELDELMAEHERALDKADPKDDRLRTQIQRRIDAIALRIQLRNTLRQQAEARAALDSGRGAVDEQLAIAERARVYTIVGQLQPSTVYDGQKLPLMYRIVSIGAPASKTLGYLKDDPQFQLKGRIGAVLGVIGEPQLDRSLMLNVITPVRIDTLRPAGETGDIRTPLPAQPSVPAQPDGRSSSSQSAPPDEAPGMFTLIPC